MNDSTKQVQIHGEGNKNKSGEELITNNNRTTQEKANEVATIERKLQIEQKNDKREEWKEAVQSLEDLDLTVNTEQSREDLNKAQVEYVRWMAIQESLLKQKTQVRWFKKGDCNSRCFSNVIKDKRRRMHLHKIKNHIGNWIQGEERIAKAAVRPFQKIFNLALVNVDENVLNCIKEFITEEDNLQRSQVPEESEIKDTIFDMSGTSSAGPDRFNGIFYQKCWGIIKEDVVKLVQSFFKGKILTKFYAHTCLVLIPKVQSPSNFA
ncbi:PREDICTED: uncharacterized protein LOC109235970 [Nicotiana attenuata]|uniref:uncharacterized protein LOC109235970 n=1 Tax=Nicotiana attenuata TaxID=49451 RepID=UPI0009050627|nr:PREDICTED: uncharacterized protein LOC109235970 [Nicotiana attenuata]